jgi:hypothetical protein
MAELIVLSMFASVGMIESEMTTVQLTPLQHTIFQLFYFIYDEANAVKIPL